MLHLSHFLVVNSFFLKKKLYNFIKFVFVH